MPPVSAIGEPPEPIWKGLAELVVAAGAPVVVVVVWVVVVCGLGAGAGAGAGAGSAAGAGLGAGAGAGAGGAFAAERRVPGLMGPPPTPSALSKSVAAAKKRPQQHMRH